MISGMGAGTPSEGSVAGIMPSARRGHEDVGRSGSGGGGERGRGVGGGARSSDGTTYFKEFGPVVLVPRSTQWPRDGIQTSHSHSHNWVSRVRAQHQPGKCGRRKKKKKKRPGNKSESIGGEREEGRKSSLDNAEPGQVVSPAELWLQRLPLKGDHRANGLFVACARRAGERGTLTTPG